MLAAVHLLDVVTPAGPSPLLPPAPRLRKIRLPAVVCFPLAYSEGITPKFPLQARKATPCQSSRRLVCPRLHRRLLRAAVCLLLVVTPVWDHAPVYTELLPAAAHLLLALPGGGHGHASIRELLRAATLFSLTFSGGPPSPRLHSSRRTSASKRGSRPLPPPAAIACYRKPPVLPSGMEPYPRPLTVIVERYAHVAPPLRVTPEPRRAFRHATPTCLTEWGRVHASFHEGGMPTSPKASIDHCRELPAIPSPAGGHIHAYCLEGERRPCHPHANTHTQYSHEGTRPPFYTSWWL